MVTDPQSAVVLSQSLYLSAEVAALRLYALHLLINSSSAASTLTAKTFPSNISKLVVVVAWCSG